MVRHERLRHRGPRADGPLAPTAAARVQPFLAIDAGQALVIRLVPLAAQEHMRPPIAEPAAHPRQFL